MGTRHWPEDADDHVEILEDRIKELRARVAELEKQRDDLLAAFDRFVEHCNEQERGWFSDGVAGLLTSIASVKGQP